MNRIPPARRTARISGPAVRVLPGLVERLARARWVRRAGAGSHSGSRRCAGRYGTGSRRAAGAPTDRRRWPCPGLATGRSALVACVPPANNDQPAAYPRQDRPAGYPLRSRCLWCREPIGWDCPIGLWVHLRSDRVWCRDRVGAWAAADPQFTTITHRLLYTAGQGSDNRPTGVETT